MSRSRRVKLSVFVVQLGLSKGNTTQDRTELLSVSRDHLVCSEVVPDIVDFGDIA